MQASTEAGSAKRFTTAITEDSFRSNVAAIAADDMQGRKPGTDGAKRATAWIAERFREAGLQPGNAGSWFQGVPMVSTQLTEPERVTLKVTGEQGGPQVLKYREDMVIRTLRPEPRTHIADSDVVFMGYGVDAPEWDWNDYAGIDVKGKTVLVLVNDPGFAGGDPKFFDGKRLTHYGRWDYKYARAARAGAAMCLVVFTSDEAACYPWSVVQNSWSGPQILLPQHVRPGPRLPAAGWVSNAGARRIFAAAGLDFDALVAAASRRSFQPVSMRARAAVEFDTDISTDTTQNVMGVVPGADLADEVVIYSAHWDHLGFNPKLPGHQIYNGAADNGTGVAALVELGRAFLRQPTPPRRSVLFLSFTLEESGLFGSEYYVAHPVFPLGKTIANINMDVLLAVGRTRNLQIIGDGKSELEDRLKQVMADQGRHCTPDHQAGEGLYFRSDHFNFAKAGVPALMTRTGDDLVDGGTERGRREAEAYRRERYHTPRDVLTDAWEFSGLVEDLEALYEVGRRLAAGSEFPGWYAGCPFKAVRTAVLQQARA